MPKSPVGIAAIDCCPPLEPCDVGDYLDFTFRLLFNPSNDPATRANPPIVIVLRFRLTRCSGPLSLGDIAYTITLLPGESVRLFTSYRHSRFSFDSETDLSYRQQTTSEESTFMAGMANAVSNVNVNEQARLDLDVPQLGRRRRRRARDRSRLLLDRRLRLGQLLRLQGHERVRPESLPARRLVEPEHGDLDACRQLDEHRRGQHAHPLRGVLRGPVRVVVAHVREPEPLPRAHLPLLQAQQVPDPEVGAGRDRPDRARPERPHRRPAEQPAAVQRRHRHSGRDHRHERQEGCGAAGRHDGTCGRAVQPAPVQRRPEGGRRGTREGGPADEGRPGLAAGRDPLQLGARDRPAEGGDHRQGLPRRVRHVRALEREIELDLQRQHLENELLKRQIELLDQAQEYRCCPDGDEPEPST